MKKEWLEDLQAKSEEEHYKYVTSRMNDSFSYVPYQRSFGGLKQPFGRLFTRNVWSQIPLFGTAVLTLPPINKQGLLEIFRLDGRDLDRLLDLAKLGKVRFLLSSNAVYYEDCDYLEPVFRELEPPVAISFGPEFFSSELDTKKHYAEFFALANIQFIPYINEQLQESFAIDHIVKRIHDYAAQYAMLKIFGYDKIIENLQRLIIDNPQAALANFSVLNNYLVLPKVDLFARTYSPINSRDKEYFGQSIALFQKTNDLVPNDVMQTLAPGEVGKLVTKKLTHLPTSYEACVSLMDKFEQEDLYKILASIQEGCNENNVDMVNAGAKELNDLLENFWDDSKGISKLAKGVNTASTVSLGVVGALATLPAFGIGGLVASLGFKVIEKTVQQPISDRIAKALYPNHLIMLHDFQTKYNIK